MDPFKFHDHFPSLASSHWLQAAQLAARGRSAEFVAGYLQIDLDTVRLLATSDPFLELVQEFRRINALPVEARREHWRMVREDAVMRAVMLDRPGAIAKLDRLIDPPGQRRARVGGAARAACGCGCGRGQSEDEKPEPETAPVEGAAPVSPIEPVPTIAAAGGPPRPRLPLVRIDPPRTTPPPQNARPSRPAAPATGAARPGGVAEPDRSGPVAGTTHWVPERMPGQPKRGPPVG